MGIKKLVEIDLDIYYKYLREAMEEEEDVLPLSKALNGFGIAGKTTFHLASAKGDKEIRIAYNLSNEKNRGFLRFREFGTAIAVDNGKGVVEVHNRLALFFVAGLFGLDELPLTPDRDDETLLSGLRGAFGCFDGNDATPCNDKAIPNARAEVYKRQRQDDRLLDNIIDLQERQIDREDRREERRSRRGR